MIIHQIPSFDQKYPEAQFNHGSISYKGGYVHFNTTKVNNNLLFASLYQVQFFIKFKFNHTKVILKQVNHKKIV